MYLKWATKYCPSNKQLLMTRDSTATIGAFAKVEVVQTSYNVTLSQISRARIAAGFIFILLHVRYAFNPEDDGTREH